jgi:hypothetical protein
MPEVAGFDDAKQKPLTFLGSPHHEACSFLVGSTTIMGNRDAHRGPRLVILASGVFLTWAKGAFGGCLEKDAPMK